ncbi:DUF3955 domain-containing protein [Psychrobacter faecalis]|jgi:hypothetical protein|uniref:DUF3955 domain-containing protein n=1 Tax=Psychrobacter faecalis TaxID=180588 RepID=UPI00191A7C15|nr:MULTISPECIES: DUF3955 domain-containing protein [Psychrobacter]MCG3861551.1 DUF3955 domain-containing protein [Psychrobacter sp. Ps5]
MKSKLFIVGSILLAVAAFFGLMETMFYGGIDSEGVLQESLFLPLTFICLALSVTFYTSSLIMQVKTRLTHN